MRQSILELVWGGAVRPIASTETNRLRRVLHSMLQTRLVFLKTNAGVDRVLVLQDDLEVMPELALGDVIVEELSVDVPYGALILIHNEDAVSVPMDMDVLSLDIGIAVGNVLLTVLRRGVFPLERENEALYIMACAYDRMARTTEMQHFGLVPTEFTKGLIGVLGSYWSGSSQARTERSGLFLETGCLAHSSLRSYLAKLEPCFAAPDYNGIPSGLLVFADGTSSFSDWLSAVKDAVTGLMGKHLQRSQGLSRKGWQV